MAPPFHILTDLVENMYNWLTLDPRNVVVVHCNSGKGRAGTATCCLLLYIGFYKEMIDCARLFGSRRFTNHMGIS